MRWPSTLLRGLRPSHQWRPGTVFTGGGGRIQILPELKGISEIDRIPLSENK